MSMAGLEEEIAYDDFGDIFQPAPLAELGGKAREEYWSALALRYTRGLGARSQGRLLKRFGGAAAACANVALWPQCNVSASKAGAFAGGSWTGKAEQEWRKALQCRASIILWPSSRYPELLRELADPPLFLYALGDINLLAGPCIALVGTRAPTANGLAAATSFGDGLASAGITVVSGLAMGIDRAAHVAALARIGSSIGVLGTGIDISYPRCNQDVYARMARKGLLVSEFAPGFAPAAVNFPIRNRIISGLSLGVVVVEAAARSGSLVTARLAVEQNREVFAIPGPALDGHSAGCQALVRQGARPVFFAEDILRDMAAMLKPYGLKLAGRETRPRSCPAQRRQPPIMPPVPAAEQPEAAQTPDAPVTVEAARAAKNLLGGDAACRILAAMRQHGTMQMDHLASTTGLNAACLSAALLGLEMAGKIRRLPGARYAIA